jgi:hypothetical protein
VLLIALREVVAKQIVGRAVADAGLNDTLGGARQTMRDERNTRDETRTRKANGRGILSPLRLPIPPPGPMPHFPFEFGRREHAPATVPKPGYHSASREHRSPYPRQF